MDRRAFWVGLRAAAKISLGTVVAGCGGVVIVDDRTPGEAEAEVDELVAAGGGGAPVAGTGGEGAGEDAPLTCEADPTLPAGGVDAPYLACCTAALSDELPDETWSWPVDMPITAAHQACCDHYVAANGDAIWGGEMPHPAPADAHGACCDISLGVPGCTPWGPPAPPVMDPQPVPWLEALWIREIAWDDALLPAEVLS